MAATKPLDLLVDTDVLWQPPVLQRLRALVSSGAVRVHFSALVIAERERQLVQREQERLANGQTVVPGDHLRLFRQSLKQFVSDSTAEVVILPFDRSQAQALSQLWAAWLKSESVERWSGPPEAIRRPPNQAERTWRVHKFDWFVAAVVHQGQLTVLTGDRHSIPFQQLGAQRMLIDEFMANTLSDVE